MAKKNDSFQNLDERQKECLALIESLGIYELRALARIFGDNSPTTLKRNDHIKIIMDKIISGEDLRPIPLRQGRPYKELSNIEGILSELSTISGKDYSTKGQPTNPGFPKVVSFHQANAEVLQQRLLPVDARGVLKERNADEFYFQNLENGTLVLVKKEMDNRLQANDYVTGSAILMNDEGEYALDVLKTINLQSNKLYVDTYAPYEQTTPTKKFNFGGKEILLGGRYVLKSKLLDDKNTLQKALQKFQQEGVVTLALIPNVMKEDESALMELGFVAPFFLRYEENLKNSYETILAFLDTIQRLQEQGLSVAIFVEDIPTIANILDYAFKNAPKSLMGHAESTVETIKRLMLLPKADKNGAHTTLFTTQDEADLFDQMFVSFVYKVSKKI